MPTRDTYDAVIIGSGIGGGTTAYAMAKSGLSILMLERGDYLPHESQNWDARSVFVDERYVARDETWVFNGEAARPVAYYFVGGASKMFGAVMTRLRAEDFGPVAFEEGISPEWPISYTDLAPYYDRAERIFSVHGISGEDPTDPTRDGDYPYGPIDHDQTVARLVHQLKGRGLHPYHLPLCIMRHAGGPCVRCATCDGFPCQVDAKTDAEIAAVRPALAGGNIELSTGSRAEKLILSPDGRSVAGVAVTKGGATREIRARLFVLAAGAINSAALLLRSAQGRFNDGLANSSGCVGRNYMAHNSSVLMAVRSSRTNIVFQKTFGLNDFYFGDRLYPYPMGNVQMIGKVQGPMLARQLRFLPPRVRQAVANRSLDWYAQSEDLPRPENRVRIGGDGRIHLERTPNNLEPHRQLLKRVTRLMRELGFPIVAKQGLGIRTTSHQCGTVRFGRDPATAALDPFCRSFDHPNLFVMDGSFFPSSAAVNPSLTIAAQALRVAEHILAVDFAIR